MCKFDKESLYRLPSMVVDLLTVFCGSKHESAANTF